jgi:hypothetical protein
VALGRNYLDVPTTENIKGEIYRRFTMWQLHKIFLLSAFTKEHCSQSAFHSEARTHTGFLQATEEIIFFQEYFHFVLDWEHV